jgi:selenide,water dikinase
MRPSDTESETNLVLVGGGHSHIEVLRQFGMTPEPRLRLSLVARDYHAPYSGMLPGFVAGHYDFYQTHIDVRPLARFAGCRVLHDEVVGLDLDNRRLRCANRPDVPFDYLSINIGSRPMIANIPGAAKHALPAKPVERFIEGWNRIRDRALAAVEPLRILVVGAGAGGVEVTLSMQHRLRSLLADRGRDIPDIQFHLAMKDHEVLHTHNSRVRAKMKRILEKRGVRLHTDCRVTKVEAGIAYCASGDPIEFDELIWVTNASPAPWIAESGIETDDAGFLAVDETLRSTSHPFVFAAGDAASLVHDPRPKSGVFAVRAGPFLARNLRRVAGSKPMEKFKPQKRFLNLISTGDKNAIASRGRWAAEGRLLWKWKDWIDTRFMEKYADLPLMDASGGEGAMDGSSMRCGGCGCKIGGSVLSRVLADLDPVKHDNVLVGLDHPDDAAVIKSEPGKVSVQTVDFFRSFLDDPYLFAQITVNHCLSDIYAMGAIPETALAIVTLPFGSESTQEQQMRDLLDGAVKTLNAHGTALVGGHTTEGAELVFGLSVQGTADETSLLRKEGMQPGDRLVLTKAIGTGVIFAADMRGKAKGHWVESAIAGMLQSNKEAATCLFEHGATACTDITGFGFAGHVREMANPTSVTCQINLAHIPVLPGAEEASRQGIASTLYPHNSAVERSIAIEDGADKNPLYPLLFDPQTSGGLLASIPEAQVQACVDALRTLGYADACVVGEVVAKDSDDKPIRVTN